MFFPATPWWDSRETPVPDGIRYLCERWWELLKDWYVISYYAPPCSNPPSTLRAQAEAIDDIQQGTVRTLYHLDALVDELRRQLKTNELLRKNFPTEISTTLTLTEDLYKDLPSKPVDRYSELKKRNAKCRRVSAAALRLHHRCMRRRKAAPDMTWTGFGGLVAAELMSAVLSDTPTPNFTRIDRLLVDLLVDCVYRGYDIDYLASLFDRYLAPKEDVRDGLLHAFRRIHSRRHHRYHIYFMLYGATELEIREGPLELHIEQREQLEELRNAAGSSSKDAEENGSASKLRGDASDSSIDVAPERDDIEVFLSQVSKEKSLILSITREGDPDAGAAATAARAQLQEIVDFLDFGDPRRGYRLAPYSLVGYTVPARTHVLPDEVEEQSSGPDQETEEKSLVQLHPSHPTEQRWWEPHGASIDPRWAEKIAGLSEALRWSAVARRETTPEVALLGTWVAFEFLAGELGKAPVDAIMEYFPTALAIGNLRRRLDYWWRSLEASPAFQRHPKADRIKDCAEFRFGGSNLRGILDLLIQHVPDKLASAVEEITSCSILLRERTRQEADAFSKPQLLAMQVKLHAENTRWDLQRFLTVRNRLVHSGRISDPLVELVARRATRMLDDLLRDLSAQITEHRLRVEVSDILQDYRDTYDELLIDLGRGKTLPEYFTDRILLA